MSVIELPVTISRPVSLCRPSPPLLPTVQQDIASSLLVPVLYTITWCSFQFLFFGWMISPLHPPSLVSPVKADKLEATPVNHPEPDKVVYVPFGLCQASVTDDGC